MALLPSVRITSKICLLTATLADKDNLSSDTLLSDKKLLLKAGEFVSDGSWGIYSACACSVCKCPHIRNANIK